MHLLETQFTVASLSAGPVLLSGLLAVPSDAKGAILFAQLGRAPDHKPRDRYLAQSLQEAGLATFLLDLIPPADAPSNAIPAHPHLEIDLLAKRLRAGTEWIKQQPELAGLPVGYFGTGTGAAAAITAAAEATDVDAVVALGGRPDLAEDAVRNNRTPTLLIVGSNDGAVAALNLEAWARLRSEKAVEIIPDTGYLYEEPETLAAIARLTVGWFNEHLRPDWSASA